MTLKEGSLAFFPQFPNTLSSEAVHQLVAGGAKLLGSLVVLTQGQLDRLDTSVAVLDLVSGVGIPAGSLVITGRLEGTDLSTASFPCAAHTLPAPGLRRVIAVGLSGSIGSGKSLALDFFKELGAVVFSADAIAREVVEPGSPGLVEVAARFGAEVIVDGKLNRAALAQIVFADPSKRVELEGILHPLIRKAYVSHLLRAISASDRSLVVVYEVPLLFESKHSFPELSEKLLVSVDTEKARERLIGSRGMTESEIDARFAAQMPLADKRRLATIEIDNSGTIEQLKAAIEQCYLQFLDSL
jgi:dephospho-CoA kinase